jgi:hypothetical protein
MPKRLRRFVRHTAMPTCVACGKRRYADVIAAKVSAVYWNQREYPCPHGNGWHLTSQKAPVA